MAKFKGILKFSGTIGGVTGVNSKEGFHIREKQNIAKSRYQKAPEYSSFRMNGRYTGMSSRMSMAFRQPIKLFGMVVSDARMYSRLNAVMRKILMSDPVSKKGEFTFTNGIATMTGKQALLDFEFNRSLAFDRVFKTAYLLDTASATLTLSGFVPKKALQWPAGATHAAMESGLLHFDFAKGEGKFASSGPRVLSKNEAATDIVLSTAAPTAGEGLTKVHFLKVAFSQEVGGVLYPLKGNEAGVMKVVAVE